MAVMAITGQRASRQGAVGVVGFPSQAIRFLLGFECICPCKRHSMSARVKMPLRPIMNLTQNPHVGILERLVYAASCKIRVRS